MPRIAYYLSGHGLGHSSRAIEVMRALRARRPDLDIAVRTEAPRWIFDSSAPRGITHHPGIVDTGLVQHDSVSIDEAASARAAANFYDTFTARVDAEAAWLRAQSIDLVVADVPPIAVAAARRAGIPGVMLANFTWDWICEAYDVFRDIAPHALDAMRTAYADATFALRLPLGGGFATVPHVRAIPLIARRSTRDRHDVRARLGVDDRTPLVLSSFSGFGLDLPLDQLRQSADFRLLAPEREPPPGLRYEDLVAAADVVVSKPGYGIVSECIANHTALLYTSRGAFVEYDVLVNVMPSLLRCRFIAPDDLRAGRWTGAIQAVLAQHPVDAAIAVNGAEVAARALLDALHTD